MKKPNIVFILSDQHRFCDMGCAGNPYVETPNLDAIAFEGAFFEKAYSNCPLCVPARGSLLTALHALNHGAAANDMKMPEGTPSVADVLNAAGYRTAYIGKWHLGGVPRDQFITEGRRLGFSHWRGCNCNHKYLDAYYDDNENVRHAIDGYEPIAQTSLALEFMEHSEGSDTPWAMCLCFGTPHDPYFDLPEGDAERYFERELNVRDNVLPINDEDTFGASKPQPDISKCYAGYYAHIRQIDLGVGRVIEKLKEMGEYENTIFVYTSDHGDMLGSHGYLNKQLWYEESAHIPLIISWPGRIPAGKRKQPISIVDIAPTLLGFVGLKFENDVDGHDMSRMLCGQTEADGEGVYFYSYVPCHQAENRKVESWRAYTDGRFVVAASENGETMCMYDLDADPLEMNDIKDDALYKKDMLRLRKALDGEVAKYDGYMPWEKLLEKRGLFGEWERSEAYFNVLKKAKK